MGDPLSCLLIGCLALVVGAVAGWLGAWLLDRVRLQGVRAAPPRSPPPHGRSPKRSLKKPN